ncbi:multifunctional CCA protein [Marinobacterium nitratireducens]|uniref:CCA-adding enzyme n=1 Tax=Marinobacterium nitratireducens TaxID=518897 RepID=A0A917ZN11_9GAMM|nr:hypothetical protein [Marinobacterium nitratireducens]GGO86410.1 multifunctional CCA protein [Marinobacterium nitratireducens]
MRVYLVGGAVRDKLLGYPVYDHDWVVVGATVQQMLEQGFQPVGADFPVFIHPDSGEEYALARTERKSGRGYTGFLYHASPDVTLEQDLKRRDLTINAMAEAEDGSLVDPYGGARDLEARVLRHVSPAFSEDPLRVLRVARFAARYAHLGFGIADETKALMRELASGDELEYLTAERVWQEFERALGERSPGVFLEVLHQCGALAILLPELEDLPAHPQWQRLAKLLTRLEDPRERFALLLAAARAEPDQEDGSAARIEALCQRLRAPRAFRDQALLIARHHRALFALKQLDGEARLSLAQGLDLTRRPQRIHSLAACFDRLAEWLGVPSHAREWLMALYEALGSIEPKALMQEGFSGKALGDELRRRQREACAQLELT